MNCFVGQTFSPPSGLRKGQTLEIDGSVWAYAGEGVNPALGNFEKFVVHQPDKQQSNKQQGVSPQVGKVEMLVEDVVARGGLTLLAAEEGAGKTALLMRLAEAVTRGDEFMGQLVTVRSRVLMLHADESEMDTAFKLRRMGIDPNLFEVMHVERFDVASLQDLIASGKWGLILMDSLTHGLTEERGGVCDDAFTNRLYKLRKALAASNVGGIATTHLNKPWNGQSRQTIVKHDIAGLSTIKNAVSDTWGLLPVCGKEDVFKMVCIGKRFCPTGTEWEIQGSVEDFSFQLTTCSRDMPKERRTLNQKIVDALSELDQESAVSSADIARVVDSSPEVTRRYCADMYGMGQIERVIVKGSGRPQHRYFNS